MRSGRLGYAVVLLATSALLGLAPPAGAGAKTKVLSPANYPDMTTYRCRTDAIPIHPGQNLNLVGATRTCPNAEVVSGPGGTSVFSSGSRADGYVTRFKPSMVEITDGGQLVTPSVWDLHLHHVVWIGPGGPTFASGEEKTIATLPQGYGLKTGGNATWRLNYMIHNLTAAGGRQVYVTWEIDWVPVDSPSGAGIQPAKIRWLDVAGRPQIYPVFDAERGFDADGNGKYVFPDEVPGDPAAPGFEERRKISPAHEWTVPEGGATLVFGAGHLHPGGLNVRLQVARDGPDAGEVDGDRRSEVRKLFRSDARYYEPAGAVSWDVSMEATRRDWRIGLKGGDTVSIDTAYDVERASWYESMGILPVAVAGAGDPRARDPFKDRKAVKRMYDRGGILTHGRLPENIDRPARKKLGLPDPRDLRGAGGAPTSGIQIDGFLSSPGGYTASPGFSSALMRPPVIERGDTVTFTSLDALPAMPQTQQAWHTVTSCKPPCNRGPGIGYPLADGPVKFDSGQLGFGRGLSSEVTTGSNVYTTPPLAKPGKTYTYFCRIHPFMRGSIRVEGNRGG
jgi:plastocyanin